VQLLILFSRDADTALPKNTGTLCTAHVLIIEVGWERSAVQVSTLTNADFFYQQMKNSISLLFTLLLITACNRPLRDRSNQSESTPRNPVMNQAGSSDQEITSSGIMRQYRLHVPDSYQENVAVPLVVNFHGYSSNARQEEALTDMSAKADREGFIVVYPEGLDSAWFTGPGADGQQDRQFVRDLISSLESQYHIDPKRIYATGISNGGGMADRVACSMADAIAAIAPDAGAYNFWRDCQPSRPVPVLAFHGLDDNIIPYIGGKPQSMAPPIEDWAAAWAERNGCASTPGVTTPVDTVTVRTWSNCRDNADVILYTLANHGHSWPGSPTMPKAITSQAVNATDLIWEFFEAHPMP
jgi:polyhydroxybutyrate depolymerase